MSKMHYFNNKFLQIAKHWRLFASSSCKLQFWWSEVSWSGQIVVFLADYDDIEVQKIVMTSSQLHYRETSLKLRHNFFPIWAPSNQNFWLRQWSVVYTLDWLEVVLVD